MKITKLLPLALVLMLVSPAFAAPVDPKTTDTGKQVLSVPKFIRITHDTTKSTEAATASFDEEYANITLDKSMVTVFHVVTNNPDEKIKLTATALAGGTQKNAIAGTADDDCVLVLTNKGTGKRAAADTAVSNAYGDSPQKAQNANAIAFKLTPAVAVDTNSAGAAPVPAYVADGIEYPVQNGIYDFSYTLGTTQIPNTFSTHDADGTYEATLTLTQVGGS